MRKLYFIVLCMQYIHTLQCYTITFAGPIWRTHAHLLKTSAQKLASKYPEVHIKYLFGQEDPSTKHAYIKQIRQIQNNYTQYEIIMPSLVKDYALPSECLEIVKNSDLIIYDFYCTFGKVLAQKYNIKTIRFIPCFCKPTTHEINILEAYPQYTETYFGHNTRHKNIFYSLNNDPFSHNRSFTVPQKGPGQKIIYISFGSWMSKEKKYSQFIVHIFQWLIDSFGNNEKYIFIAGNVQDIHQNLKEIPDNFYLYEELVPQTEILKHADIFITHCGIHSINEALHACVPMIGIPLECEQPISAKNIKLCNIGISFLKDKIDELKRHSLNQKTLHNAIIKILENHDFYTKNIQSLTTQQPQDFVEIIEEIIGL